VELNEQIVQDEVYEAEEVAYNAPSFTASQTEDISSDHIVMQETLKSKSVVAASAQPQTVLNFVATSAALTINDDGIHKFIRTAKLRFKVENVISGTQAIEDIIIRNKGFIINSSIYNRELSTEWINISKDSAVVVRCNNLEATLQLKVPCELLDTTLRQIAPLAISIDYRVVEATDVTAKLMSDDLTKKRLAKKEKRLENAIDTKGRRLNDITYAEDALDRAQEQADRTKVSEYITNEQIAYSTITIELHQNTIKYNEKVLRNDEVSGYEPGFGSKVIEALYSGWEMLSVLFIFLINLWPILLIIAISIFLYKKIRNKKDIKE
jgi:hypothetical protein